MAPAKEELPVQREMTTSNPRLLQGFVVDGCQEEQEAPAQGVSLMGPLWGAAMLLSGTLCTIFAKMLLNTKAEGLELCDGGLTYCKFDKPWFIVLLMKIGMSCLVVFQLGPRSSGEARTTCGTLLKIALPSFLDLANVLLSNIGLVWVASSIYQMTRGSLVVFSAVLTVQLLRRRLLAYQFWAVGLVSLAVILVGLAGIMSSGAGDASLAEIGLGLFLILISQVVLAYQIVVEERLMTERGVTPFQLAAFEGLWGLVFFVVLVPVLTLTPGNAHPGQEASPWLPIYHEDFRDTFEKLRNSKDVVLWCCLYMVVIAAYNVSGQAVTKYLSAVLRSILEACRTLGVWIAGLLVFYAFGLRDERGEKWTAWSWAELAGFMVLVYGTMAYKGLMPIPCAPVRRQASVQVDPCLGA